MISRFLRQTALMAFSCFAAGVLTAAFAQSPTVAVDVLPGAPGRLLIEGAGPASQSWSFRDSYAGIVGLGNRVRGFQGFDANGKQIAVRTIAPGQFASAELATRFKYEIDLKPTARPSDAAFVSWLGPENGMLMFGDLLPQPEFIQEPRAPTTVRLVLPSGWTAYASDTAKPRAELEIADPDQTVVLVGKNIRVSTSAILGKPFTVLTDGDWAFTDDDALQMATSILQFHSKTVGLLPCESASLVLLPFSQPTSPNKWSAQTRGCTTTLLMSKVPSKTGALAQLGNALTHELFHLWVPNGVALTGDYDWFYEGFTMYQAARAAVRLDLLSFEQFLNAIADAYDGSLQADAQKLSLIEASKQRWTAGAPSVYSKAMVVAFIYDLDLRAQSKGKRSLDDVYRHLFSVNARNVRLQNARDGNAAAMAVLRAGLPAGDFTERFVTAPAAIELEKELAPFGLRVEKFAVRTHISVADHPRGGARDLLKQLGYNEPRRR